MQNVTDFVSGVAAADSDFYRVVRSDDDGISATDCYNFPTRAELHSQLWRCECSGAVGALAAVAMLLLLLLLLSQYLSR